MKTNNIFNKGLLLGILCLPLVFTACSDDDGVEVGETSKIKIVNASESSTPQDFYLNNTKVNSSAIAYENTEGYISTKSGSDQDAEFRTSGSTTVFASKEVDLSANKDYSFFLHGEGASTSIIVTEDDLSNPPAGKAKVRFIHLSTAANNNVDISLLNTKLVSDLSFNETTSFSTIDPGVHLFQVFEAGTTTNPIDLNLEAFVEGKIYTVVISGSTSANAFLVTNK